MIAIDLSKQQALDADPKSLEEIDFTGKSDRQAGAIMLFIDKKVKETVLDFSQGTVKVF